MTSDDKFDLHMTAEDRSGYIITEEADKKRPRRQCMLCPKSYSEYSNLYRHIRLSHKDEEESYIKTRKGTLCPVCGESLRGHEPLRNHIKNIHGVFIERQKIRFPTEKDFQEWKEAIEVQTKSFYVRSTKGASSKTGDKHLYYRCFRSGLFQEKIKGIRIRRLKHTGSVKMNGHCPSIMEIRKSSARVKVVFYSTHFGHDFDVKFLPPKIRLKAEDLAWCHLLEDPTFAYCIICNRKFKSNQKTLDSHLRTQIHLKNIQINTWALADLVSIDDTNENKQPNLPKPQSSSFKSRHKKKDSIQKTIDKVIDDSRNDAYSSADDKSVSGSDEDDYIDLELNSSDENFSDDLISNLVQHPNDNLISNSVQIPRDDLISNSVQLPRDDLIRNSVQHPRDDLISNPVQLSRDDLISNSVQHPRDDLISNSVQHPRDDLISNSVQHPKDDFISNSVQLPRDDLISNSVQHPRDDISNSVQHPRDDLISNSVQHPRDDLISNSVQHSRDDLISNSVQHTRDDLIRNSVQHPRDDFISNSVQHPRDDLISNSVQQPREDNFNVISVQSGMDIRDIDSNDNLVGSVSHNCDTDSDDCSRESSNIKANKESSNKDESPSEDLFTFQNNFSSMLKQLKDITENNKYSDKVYEEGNSYLKKCLNIFQTDDDSMNSKQSSNENKQKQQMKIGNCVSPQAKHVEYICSKDGQIMEYDSKENVQNQEYASVGEEQTVEYAQEIPAVTNAPQPHVFQQYRTVAYVPQPDVQTVAYVPQQQEIVLCGTQNEPLHVPLVKKVYLVLPNYHIPAEQAFAP